MFYNLTDPAIPAEGPCACPACGRDAYRHHDSVDGTPRVAVWVECACDDSWDEEDEDGDDDWREEWRREIAMEAGMLGGCDAYNEVMGWD